MTLITTSNMIFIGNQPLIDVNENDGFYENAGVLAGNYSDLEMVEITNHDVTEDGVIWSDESGSPDFIEYTIDGVTYSSPQDAIILYNAIITERDGTVHNVEVSVIQAPNGDTFINDKGNNGATDNLNIKTIELTTVTSDSAAGRNTFASTQNTAVCFGTGTWIMTPGGARRIETLRSGDVITTLDGQAERIAWIGVSQFAVTPRQTPVVFDVSSLGEGYPSRTLVLSPQHRVLVGSQIVERMFGVQAVFVSAQHLVALHGVERSDVKNTVQYWHILCSRHTVVLANDLPVETLFPGHVARANLPHGAHIQIERIVRDDPVAFAKTCFDVPPAPAQRKLVSRHAKNNKPCISARVCLALNAGVGALARQNALEPARLIQ